MSNRHLVLGLNRTSDASFCLLRGNEVLALGRKERLNRKKHAWGSLGDLALYCDSHQAFGQPIAAIVECFSSDPERSKLKEYRKELDANLRLADGAIHAEISHHFAHAYSAFRPSGFAEAAILVVDNRGSPKGLVLESPEVSSVDHGGPLEVISIFDADATGIRAVSRQWWDQSPDVPAGLGMFYAMAARAVFGGGNREGVLMGLAAHGCSSRLRLPPLEVRHGEVVIPVEWLRVLSDADRFAQFRHCGSNFSDAADFAARVQAAFEEALIAVARHARVATGRKSLVFAGGCALNCSANARLIAEAGFERVFIPPACDDGGTSLGCALYGAERLGADPFAWTWDVDYLGPSKTEDAHALASMAADLNLVVCQPAGLLADVARGIADGEIVALYQGRSEAGPRALGNRSILASPRDGRTRDFVNSQVKHREWFRPLAPVVRQESASRFFEMSGPSPFMQRRVLVRPEWREALGAVCHVDGSARVQTVTRSQNSVLYDLLSEFEHATGIDLLLNTSFNGAGEPIVESLADACSGLSRMKIDRLIVPPFSAIVYLRKQNAATI